MTTTAWAHLPNAKHIDAVLVYVREMPKAWAAARGAVLRAVWDVARGAARAAARETARETALDSALASAQSAARETALDSALASAQSATWGATWGAAWDAIAALVAWDSSADLLECTPDVLRAMIDLAEPPVCHQAVLLLPYAIVRSNAKQEVT